MKRETNLILKRHLASETRLFFKWNCLLINSLLTHPADVYLNEDAAVGELSMQMLEIYQFKKRFLNTDKAVASTMFKEYSYDIFEQYSIFRYSSFIEFFDKHDIDVPKCFKGVRSLRRPNFELLLLKFSSVLMMRGQKERAFKLIVETLYRFSKTYDHFRFSRNKELLKWREIYNLHSAFWSNSAQLKTVFNRYYDHTWFNNVITRQMKFFFTDDYLKISLFSILFFIRPLFSFAVYNVDKNLKKYKRKLDSRYIFVWKYVPAYKRKIVILKLVKKDIKFSSGRGVKARFYNSLLTFAIAPSSSFVYKINHFTNNYVFKNLQKTLLKDLKSTA